MDHELQLGRLIFFFCPQCFFLYSLFSSYLISLFSMSYLIIAVPMHKWFGEHSCMSAIFLISILNGTSSLRSPRKGIRTVNRVLLNGTLILPRKGKVFYGHEPHTGESATTVRGANYQLCTCSNVAEVARCGTFSCSRAPVGGDS